MFSLELKLDEQYEAGGAAGGKMWADGAAKAKYGQTEPLLNKQTGFS